MSTPSKTTKAFIHFRNVDVCNQETKVLRNMTFCVEPGEHMAILGPNGAGKSSLVKLICGDLRPVYSDYPNREAILFGQSRWSIWSLKSHLGIITNDLHHQYSKKGNSTGWEVIASGFFDSLGLYQQLTVEQIEKVEHVIDFIGVRHLMDKEIGHMSSGEGGKCLIGRALVCNPQAMMLDEPTTGLDIRAQNDFFRSNGTIVGGEYDYSCDASY